MNNQVNVSDADFQDNMMAAITDEMAEAKFIKFSTDELLAIIEKLQGVQKTRHYTHPLWKIASSDLAWLFREMQRRTKQTPANQVH